MNNKKSQKTLVFSLGLAALTLTANNLTAQEGGGLFGRGTTSDHAEYSSRGLTDVTINSNTGSGITNADFGETTPLGSGIAILIGAGLGYVSLKKKEDKQ